MTDAQTIIRSMTGFGTSSGTATGADGLAIQWRWDLKSVNGKGLDIRFRLPTSVDSLEHTCRTRLKTLRRGNVSATLTLEQDDRTGGVVVNEAALATMVAAAERIRLMIDCVPPSPEGLLSLKGVLQPAAEAAGLKGQDTDDALASALLAGLDEAAAALEAFRAREGAALGGVLKNLCEELLEALSGVRDLQPTAREAHRARLSQQLAVLLDGDEFDPDRLAQEVALLATRSDIAEEVDRLAAHLIAVQELLSGEGPHGRKLDFLAQELMREATTLTTKAATMEMKQLGLVMKSAIDQFKEQVQNVL